MLNITLAVALLHSLLGGVVCITYGRHPVDNLQTCGYIRHSSRQPEIRQNSLKASDARVCARAEERFYKMITDKHAQVNHLLEQHKDPNDRLQLRLNFVECTANHKLSEMLRRHSTESAHGLSVIADMKRRTPTHNPKCDNAVLSYVDAAEVARNMAQVGFDVIFVNTDDVIYGGHILELHKCFLELRKLGRRTRPAIVMKDIILHPIQIAQAAEYRADGVLLNAAILGNALKDMIVACITMGIEAIVEVHTAADAMRSLDMGATHLLVNQWDRVENILRPTRALEVKEIVGDDATFIAAGGIVNYSQIHELGLIGYDAVVLGRRLMYNDLPQFVDQVKKWRAPCKSILRISKSVFFDMKQVDDETMLKIKIKEDHMKVFNEMNTFYNTKSADVSKILNTEDPLDPAINQINGENASESETDAKDAQNNDKVVTLSYGNPRNTTFVKNILATPESPDSMIDANQYFGEQLAEMYEMKWYIEQEKWIRANRHHFKTREDAEKAHKLKKAVEVYTAFKINKSNHPEEKFGVEDVEKMERDLMEHVKLAYQDAPRDEHGNVIMPL
ncbi:Indole-3-glycerol phosphate synthase [Babesia divergens]|uniref:indole-3-glycerol-phosphate synthase n=1 Tax=Babesia divergens TaxID=32595 RepID=A0AAD9LKH1_BABDI|nr:Indole-3-glycerol phosphate synthase [Babesia divergens]